MAQITPAALRTQIASGALDPIYLITGDDEHEKAEVAAEFDEAVEEELRPFNIERFYGGEGPLGAVLDAVRTMPMMAPRRVVVFVRAELALQPKRESESGTRGLEAFEAYLAAPSPETTLVVVASGLDERRRVTKRLIAKATIVRCGDLEDVADAQRWIRARMTADGREMASDAVRELAGRVGPDVGRLRSEVDRLLLYTGDAPVVSVADVREVSGPAGVSDDWAVARAIERGQAATALRELGLALDGGAVPYLVLGQLGWVVRTKLPPARVKAAVEALYRTDLSLKRSGGEARVLLERLVVELCGAAWSAAR
jgi:DNA polymerase-3 subunit delta